MKRGLCLFGAAWMFLTISLTHGGGKGSGVYESHSKDGRRLPFVSGDSYYEYQWALKNRGDFSVWMEGIHGGQPEGETAFQAVTDPHIQKGKAGGAWWVQASAGADTGMETAWKFYEQAPERRPVIVAVIDTGVDISHPELADSIWVNEDEIPGDGIDNDHNGYVDDINGWNFCKEDNQVVSGLEEDHGTHSSGTIAAAWDGQGTCGIADSRYVKLMVLKVLDTHEGKGVSSSVKRAIRYAQDNGASICNLSMGTMTRDEELERLMRDSPMLFVVSAGNGDASGRGYSIDDLPMYPASFGADNIITVGSMLFDGSLDVSSNFGRVSVDLAAPGMAILGPVPDRGYAYMSGTSMAAPMVTGTAALIYSCRLDMDLMEVKKAILDSARPVESMEGKTATGGVLDAYGAITYSLEPGI